MIGLPDIVILGIIFALFFMLINNLLQLFDNKNDENE